LDGSAKTAKSAVSCQYQKRECKSDLKDQQESQTGEDADKAAGQNLGVRANNGGKTPLNSDVLVKVAIKLKTIDNQTPD